jgi:hypothetical protein
MFPSFRKLVLVLVAFGLLSSLQAFADSDFNYKKLEIVDLSQDEQSSEQESYELEDWNFFNHPTLVLRNFELSPKLEKRDDADFLTHFSSVPTSPPKA